MLLQIAKSYLDQKLFFLSFSVCLSLDFMGTRTLIEHFILLFAAVYEVLNMQHYYKWTFEDCNKLLKDSFGRIFERAVMHSTWAAGLSSSERWVSPATALAVTCTPCVVLVGESTSTVAILVSICSLSWKGEKCWLISWCLHRYRSNISACFHSFSMNRFLLPSSLHPSDLGRPLCSACQKLK